MAWDPKWEKIFASRPWGKYPSEDVIRFVAKHFYNHAERSKVKILEVGCGTGANLWYLSREGFDICGVEGSRTGVSLSRCRLDEEVPGWKGDVSIGDIRELPYPECFFDGVLDVQALSHNGWDESRAIIKEIWRVLKKDGSFFSRTFGRGCWGDETGNHVGKNAWEPAEGPISGVGLVRFTAKEDISELYSPFSVESVESLTRTLQNGEKEIKEWVIDLRK